MSDNEGHHVDEKYVVFKAGEWDDFYDKIFALIKAAGFKGDTLDNLMASPPVLHDAVVIRTRDIFASPGLMAYAGVVQTAVELAEIQGVTMVGGTTVKRLKEIADYFSERAFDAANNPSHRVPD